MPDLLSFKLTVTHDPISGNFFVIALYHDGGYQVGRFQWRGPILLHLLAEVVAEQLKLSAEYDSCVQGMSYERHQEPPEQSELPF